MIREEIRKAIEAAQAKGRNNIIRGSFRERDCWGEGSIKVRFFKSFGSIENLEEAFYALVDEMFDDEQLHLMADEDLIIEDFCYEFNGIPCTLGDIKSFL